MDCNNKFDMLFFPRSSLDAFKCWAHVFRVAEAPTKRSFRLSIVTLNGSAWIVNCCKNCSNIAFRLWDTAR
jgi:hypothetical protein